MIYNNFTEEELNILSNGILALIHNACTTNKKVYAYDFFEGDKGVVFATSEENATDKVKYIYGTEYCNYHDIEVKEAEMWDVDVFSTTNTWN